MRSGRLPSVMTHDFSQSPQANIPRSSFNRSHGYKTTFTSGFLVPVYVDEALPGDTFSMHMTAFARLATPIVPFMDNLFFDSFFFAVPYRLVWDNWEKFNGQQTNPGDSIDYMIPQMVSPFGGYANGTLSDYFGIPTKVAGLSHSSLWHRAYALIWNEWFRDENLQNSTHFDTGDGPDTWSNYFLLRRGKRKDYFTSALPFPQKGGAVDLPLGTTAPIIGLAGASTNPYTSNLTGAGYQDSGGNTVTGSNWIQAASNPGNFYIQGDNTTKIPQVYADLTHATAATINSLRQAFQIQKLLERDARGGTRYTEIIRSHFGVVSPDARLQRPEYLGGGSVPVNINPVAQTSSTDTTTPQGNLAAFGTVSSSHHAFTKSFVEHCLLIGMVSVRADLNYQQGLNRMFSRLTRYDFYWPALSHIGEQAILNKEIYAQGSANPTADAGVFGYQERYAEYRYKPSTITGQFRSNDTLPLDYWHLAENFGSLPFLNGGFIQEQPPVDRVVAAIDVEHPQLLLDLWFNYKCARPMPAYSVPGLVDHF